MAKQERVRRGDPEGSVPILPTCVSDTEESVVEIAAEDEHGGGVRKAGSGGVHELVYKRSSRLSSQSATATTVGVLAEAERGAGERGEKTIL